MPIEEPAMEKKNAGKLAALGKCNQEPKLRNPDYNGSSRGGGWGGRRPGGPATGTATGRRPQPQRCRQMADKRPRERGQAGAGAEYGHREQVAGYNEGSLGTNKGSKKGYQDASYLVNFRCESARDAHAERYSGSQWHQQRPGYQNERSQRSQTRVFRPRHVKEQYLQAKCQLVVRDDGDYAANLADPDQLVDWATVEQVWLHEDEPTTCPICLYPPTVARITRCGHTYCCACLLHYLALSDQDSRKCPICEETVRYDQVRRCRLVPRPAARLGDTVAFRLMRRQAGSLLAQPVDEQQRWQEVVTLADSESRLRLARLILATPEQVAAEILAPERVVLEQQLAELADEPEACFVQQALTRLAENESAVAERAAAAAVTRAREQAAASSPAPLPAVTPRPAAAADTIVYQSAFDEQIVEEVVAAGAETEVSPALQEAAVVPVETGTRQRSVSETSGTEVTAADLEVPQTEPGAAAEPQRDEQQQPLYYYQAEGGEPVYLHALNCRMLLTEHGSWEHCPHRLTAPLVDVDAVTMTAGFRQRLRSLRHLPLTTQLQVVEVRLRPPDVSHETLALFKDQVKKREQRRRDKQRRERQLERRIRQEESRRSRPPDALYQSAFPAAEPRRPPTPPLQGVHQQPEPEPGAPPSFAQLLRAGAAGGGGGGMTWPSVVRPAPAAAPALVPAWEARPEDAGAAPSFSDSWSADLAAALEKVDHDRSASGATVADARHKSRKGKKGRTVVISGGLNF